jgi:aldehyde dehydrogenase
MAYERPEFQEKYDNFIGGEWVAPADGKYFENFSPVDNKLIAKVAQSNRKDIDLAVDAG